MKIPPNTTLIHRASEMTPASTAAPHVHREQKRNHQQVLEREPHCAELQQPGSFRIEHAARDVNVGHGIAVEEHVAGLEVEQERQDRDGCRQPCQQRNVGSAWW